MSLRSVPFFQKPLNLDRVFFPISLFPSKGVRFLQDFEFVSGRCLVETRVSGETFLLIG